MNQLKKTTTFLRYARDIRLEGKQLPPEIEMEVIQKSAFYQVRNPCAETSSGTSTGVGKSKL